MSESNHMYEFQKDWLPFKSFCSTQCWTKYAIWYTGWCSREDSSTLFFPTVLLSVESRCGCQSFYTSYTERGCCYRHKLAIGKLMFSWAVVFLKASPCFLKVTFFFLKVTLDLTSTMAIPLPAAYASSWFARRSLAPLLALPGGQGRAPSVSRANWLMS